MVEIPLMAGLGRMPIAKLWPLRWTVVGCSGSGLPSSEIDDERKFCVER